MWEHFYALSAIPRPPGREEKVREHLKALAAGKGWETEQDGTGNLVIRVPGRGCLAGASPLILQGHMDMVCEKEPHVAHDFLRDGLRLRIDGDWLRATGTTLGADNGIGMALALAAAESGSPDRVPLELLFTVDEETGLTGAMRLDASLLRGRRLINLDSEDEGVFIVGCAGGCGVTVRFSRQETGHAVPAPAVRCRIGGLRGGHSGINIHEGRANAIVTAAELMERLRRESGGLLLLDFQGGTKINVIPRDAEFLIGGLGAGEARRAVEEEVASLRALEPGAVCSFSEEEPPVKGPLPWGMVDLVGALPKGVLAMDPHIEGLVHTSSNVGVVRSDGQGGTLQVKIRSSEEARRDEECRRIARLAGDRGGSSEREAVYPGWEPNPDSDLVKRLAATYRALFGRDPDIRGIHAGLEAGLIGGMIGTTELVSLGPTIENAHSPGEGLLIRSAENVCRFLRAFVGSPECG